MSTLHTECFMLGEDPPLSIWDKVVLGGLQSSLDILKYKKISYPCRGPYPDAAIVQPTA
jgi:hypothetical protein